MDDSAEESIVDIGNGTKESDPSKIQIEFLRSGKSSELGVLLTHGGSYKWHRQAVSRSGEVIW